MGIDLKLNGVADRLERLVITDNTIRPRGRARSGGCLTGGSGVNLAAGEGDDSAKNVISDVLIARNSIAGNPDVGIRVVAGSNGGDANTVERLRILDNRVKLREERRLRCFETGGVHQQIALVAGDDTPLRQDDNLLRDVEVSRNRLATGEGVRVFAGSGGARNAIRGLRITRNKIRVVGPYPGVNVHGCEGGNKRRATSASRISDVTVAANRITIVKPSLTQTRGEPPRGFLYLAYAGIYVTGADFAGLGPVTRARVEDVHITRNRVDTRMIGINLIGAFGGRGIPATRNVLSNVVVAGNVVPRPPKPVFRYRADTRGINVAGGVGNARGNRVACVRLRGNRVAGRRNVVSVVANALGATRNRASLRGC
jgi:hypothetical protein